MKDNLKSRGIVEGSILAAIILILMLVSNIPGIGYASYILVPITTAILYVRYGWKIATLAGGVATILTGLFLGIITAISAGCIVWLVGIPLGIGIKKKYSSVHTTVYITIGNIIAIYVGLLATFYMTVNTGVNGIIGYFTTQFQEELKMAISLSSNDRVKNQFEYMLSLATERNIQILLLISIIITGFIIAIIMYRVSTRILGRIGIEVKKLREFPEWFVSPFLVAALVVLAVIGMELKINNIPLGREIFVGSWAVLFMLFVLQECSLISYFLIRRLKVKKSLAYIIIAILLFTGTFIYFVVIGFVDVILDYRSVDPDSLGSYIRKKFNKG
ncbi:MAG: DUF2232 domain-containing protein [Sarcina sp.]